MTYLSLLKDRLKEYYAIYFEDLNFFEFEHRDYGWLQPDKTFPAPTNFHRIQEFLKNDILSEEYLKNEMFHDSDYLFAHDYCSKKNLFHKIHLESSRGEAIDHALITLMISFRVLLFQTWNDGIDEFNFNHKIDAITTLKKEAF